ncbi:DUF58 domain-containing protein [Alteromonas flava]|uniref:DUF58 domain-containing protein n=1 Tax=Alteromonas flava TaxID=2048003 RepID=UPI000C2825EE|nr:DUF58 domain-containing protein [Alteromonas flava]
MHQDKTLEHWLSEYLTDGIHLNANELIRYRHHTKKISLNPTRTPAARLAGSYVSKLKGRGMEFDESRHYQAGDDIRAIDWRVTARTGKTHTKIYREERERPIYIVTDLSTSMQFGSEFMFKAVQAAHVSALIAWAGIARGDKLGALAFNQTAHIECKPKSRQSAVLQLIHQIIELQQQALAMQKSKPPATTDNALFNQNCARLLRLAKPGSLIWIVSDFHHLDEQTLRILSDLNRHSEVRAAAIYDPMEYQLPVTQNKQLLSITDGTTKRALTLGDNTVNQRYSDWATQRNSRLSEALERSQIAGFNVSAGLPLLAQSLAVQPRRYVLESQ